MIKRLLCLCLAAGLLLSLASCRRGGESFESSSDLPATESPDVPEDTAPPNDIPSAAIGYAFENLTLNGEACFAGEVSSSLAAAKYTLRVPHETDAVSLELSGWVGYAMAIDSFGYRIDHGEAMYGLFSTHTEAAVKEAGGEYALRFTLTAPLLDLDVGAHTVALLVRLADGTEHSLLPDLTVVIEGFVTDTSLPFHSALTHINGTGPKGSGAYMNRGGFTNKGVDFLNAASDGKTVDAKGQLRVSGWLALEGGVDRYVWSTDGTTWYTALTGGVSGEPSAGHFAKLGFENATENALFTDLILDLSPCNGSTVAVTVGGVSRSNPDRVVPFITLTNLLIPYEPADITYSFETRATDNPNGTELAYSDLAYQFQCSYGSGNLRHVAPFDNVLAYRYSGIHSFQALMDGRFAMVADVCEMSGSSFFFIRGAQSVVSVDPVPIPLHNFYETDGSTACGGAGIYARLNGDTLTVIIKGLNPHVNYRIKNYEYTYKVSGSELTLADDGSTVYVLVDGREITRITLEGEVEYPTHLASVSPAVKFAERATIVTAGGKTSTVTNTLVASTCQSQCGAAVRAGDLAFTELKILPFSEANIPTS